MSRRPIIGSAFDTHFMNAAGIVSAYLGELAYYRPRGRAALMKEGRRILSALEAGDAEAEVDIWDWSDDVEALLTDWARGKTRNPYIFFGRLSAAYGSVGFGYCVDSALEDCDLRLDAGDSVPRGFSGLAAFVSDHGNVTVQSYSRGRMTRELFSVV